MIEVRSDVGGGKTTLIQGIAAGMGFNGEVPSPTFTLSRAYPVGRGLTLYHFDLYRLSGRDIVTEELDEVADDPRAVVAVEWAQHGAAKLPTDRLQITLTPGATPELRHITISGEGPQVARIVKGLSV
jgi:tRNA threonylcarbamoyladenosine biosynthesis protein TsaE